MNIDKTRAILNESKGNSGSLFTMKVSRFMDRVQTKIDSVDKDVETRMKKGTLFGTELEATKRIREKYVELTAYKVDTEEDLQLAEWIFNGGSLRSDEEIEKALLAVDKQEEIRKNNEAMNKKGYAALQFMCIFMFILFPLCVWIILGIMLAPEFSITAIIGNLVVMALMLSYVAIPLMIAGGVIGMFLSKEVDESYGVKHTKDADKAICCGLGAALLASTLAKKRKGPSSKEI